MQEILKVAILGIIGVLVAVQLKNYQGSYGYYIIFGLGLIIFSYALQKVRILAGQMTVFNDYLDQEGEYIRILLKVTGITYVCEYSAGICKDAGYSSLSGQIEILGKLSVLTAGLPILMAVIGEIFAII